MMNEKNLIVKEVVGLIRYMSRYPEYKIDHISHKVRYVRYVLISPDFVSNKNKKCPIKIV